MRRDYIVQRRSDGVFQVMARDSLSVAEKLKRVSGIVGEVLRRLGLLVLGLLGTVIGTWLFWPLYIFVIFSPLFGGKHELIIQPVFTLIGKVLKLWFLWVFALVCVAVVKVFKISGLRSRSMSRKTSE